MPVKLEKVCLSFGEREVLKDFSIEFMNGTTALYGPSGIGKTTLINIIMGLIKPDSGMVKTGGACISAVFQEPRLLDWLMVRENILLPLSREESRLADEWAGRLSIEYLLDKRPPALSGGEKQRVSIARAMAYYDRQKARGRDMLLILDEPFTGLDEAGKNRAAGYIKESIAGGSCIVISHDYSFCTDFADEVLILEGPPVEIAGRV